MVRMVTVIKTQVWLVEVPDASTTEEIVAQALEFDDPDYEAVAVQDS